MATSFSDYDYYTAHGGKLSEMEYNAFVDDAHAEILSQTNGKAVCAPDSMQEPLKLCECRLVDVIAAYQSGAALLPKGVNSISNDGYSVSAGAGMGETSVQAEFQDKYAVCMRYLQIPCNLMCRWMG